MKDVADGERIPRLVEEMRRMAAAVEDFEVFFELLPHVLRDEALRRRMVLLFRWYWNMKLDWLGVKDGDAALADPDLLGLAQLLSAVIDGLAIQAAVDPKVDLANPYRVLTRMLEGLELGAPRPELPQAVGVQLPPHHRVQIVGRLVAIQELGHPCRRGLGEVAATGGSPRLERRPVHDRPPGAVPRVTPRVRVAEHGPPGARGRHHVEGERLVVDLDRPSRDAQGAEHLVVDDELVRREAVERREDAGRVQHVLRVRCAGRCRSASADSMPACASGRWASVTEPPARTGTPSQWPSCTVASMSDQYAGAPIMSAPLCIDESDDVPP